MKKNILLLFLLTANLLFAQSWSQVLNAEAPDAATSDYFGLSVSISGNYAIVGARLEDEDASGNNTLSGAGSAYIFELSDGSWTFMQKIVADDREESDNFGHSVSISGDYAIVGSPQDQEDASGNNTLVAAGSAYIFQLSGGTWTQMQKIVPSERAEYDRFGHSVSISGNYAIAGAYGDDEDASGNNTLSSAGSAYIFELSGGTWTEDQKIVASDRGEDDQFSRSVAISGNYAIAGAFYDDENSSGIDTLSNAGSAYIFELSGGTWTEVQKVVASDRALGDYFGYSVTISENYAIIGAITEDEDSDGNNTASSAGSAYIFELSGGTWSEMQKITASDRIGTAHFGSSVSISGNHAIVGAEHDPNGVSGGSYYSRGGSAYIFELSGGTWTEDQKIVASDRSDMAYFGQAAAIDSGKVIVGAYGKSDDTGGAYIFENPEAAPVELTSFDGDYVAENVELIWETATEVNNYGFEVERQYRVSSSEYRDWENIGFVEGHGTVNTPYSYSFVDSTLPQVDTVSYRLKQLDLGGAYEYSKVIEVVINNSSVTGVEDEDLPSEFGLAQNYPNPFNPTTSIEYRVSSNENVSIKVYDMLGREVMTLVNEVKSPGTYNVKMDGSRLASGVYVYRMTAGSFSSVKKFVLMK